MTTSFAHRRRKLSALLEESRLDALLVTRPANWLYLTGFSGDSCALVATRGVWTLITDRRFIVQAREETNGVRVRQLEKSLFESSGKLLRELHARRLGFDPTQLTISQLQAARKTAGSNMRWVPLSSSVESLRMRKDASELA